MFFSEYIYIWSYEQFSGLGNYCRAHMKNQSCEGFLDLTGLYGY